MPANLTGRRFAKHVLLMDQLPVLLSAVMNMFRSIAAHVETMLVNGLCIDCRASMKMSVNEKSCTSMVLNIVSDAHVDRLIASTTKRKAVWPAILTPQQNAAFIVLLRLVTAWFV